MAIRRPLKIEGSDLKQFSDDELLGMKQHMANIYSASPTNYLRYLTTGGSLGTIEDTRLTSGTAVSEAGNQDADDDGAAEYPTELETGEPETKTIQFSRIDHVNSPPSPAELGTSGTHYFIYFNAENNVQVMTLQDMIDTFAPYVANYMAYSKYTISTAATLSGYNEMGIVYADTRADVAAYAAGNIGGTGTIQDLPQTIAEYRLYSRNNFSVSPIQPAYIDSNNNIRVMSDSDRNSRLYEVSRHALTNVTGMIPDFSIDGPGTTLGSVMTNTKLNGSGNYQTRFVGVDDYRAQEFPNGSSEVVNQYRLKGTLV